MKSEPWAAIPEAGAFGRRSKAGVAAAQIADVTSGSIRATRKPIAMCDFELRKKPTIQSAPKTILYLPLAHAALRSRKTERRLNDNVNLPHEVADHFVRR